MRLTKKPKFLIVQYAPGSAGKFLTSLLMSSSSLAHFDITVEKNKTVQRCVDYIQSHFSSDINHWMSTEPNHGAAWNLHFISSKYSRGDDLTIEQIVELAEKDATDHFCESVNQNKFVPSIWHKSNIPTWFNESKLVTVIIDPPSLKWYHRAAWRKLYGWKEGKIHLKMNDPSSNRSMSRYYQKFDNPIFSDENFFSFVQREIINGSFKKSFLSPDNFAHHPMRSFVNLSDLLDHDSCIIAIDRICEALEIFPVPFAIVDRGHHHWSSCHTFKYSK